MSLNDTPRTYCAQYDVKIEGAHPDSNYKRVVDAVFSESLERELAAALNDRDQHKDQIFELVKILIVFFKLSEKG